MKDIIESGKTALGIEFGSTKIKAVLIDENNNLIATSGHKWENKYENGVWTYSLDDIWSGLQDCYSKLAATVKEKYDAEITKIGAMGFSAMMHGYMAFDKDDTLLVPLEHGEILSLLKLVTSLLRYLISIFHRDGVLHIFIRQS